MRRNRIVPAWMPRMTAADTPRTKPEPLDRAMRTHSLRRVFGTTWLETAMPTQRRTDPVAIHADHQKQQCLHVGPGSQPGRGSTANSLRISANSAARSRALRSRVTRKTTSRPFPPACCPDQARNNSRACRFTRLRRTAEPASFRDTTSPNRNPALARQ